MKINPFAVWWFAFGIVFFILAVIAAFNEQADRATAYLGICVACHARCEIKVLQRRMEEHGWY